MCTFFLRNQKCKFGDDCRKFHIISLEANKDVRPGVRNRPTQEAKELAAQLIKFDNSKKQAGNRTIQEEQQQMSMAPLGLME